MDSKTEPGKELAFDIAGIMNMANRIIKKVETGEGLGIPPEKMDEFKKAMKDQNTGKMVDDLKARMEELKTTINKKTNNGPDNKPNS